MASRWWCVAILVSIPRLAMAQLPEPSFALTFQPDAVEVSNLTAGGKVVWFGATQEIAEDEVAEIRAYASIAEDADLDGVERIEFPNGVPLHSTWVAVDLQTGVAVSGAPDGYPLRDVHWQGAGVQNLESGAVITDSRQTGNLLVVRSKVGAWLVEAGDGGPTDLDASSNGSISLEIAALEPLGDTVEAAPEQLAEGDVVAMLDPRRLELTLVTVQ